MIHLLHFLQSYMSYGLTIGLIKKINANHCTVKNKYYLWHGFLRSKFFYKNMGTTDKRYILKRTDKASCTPVSPVTPPPEKPHNHRDNAVAGLKMASPAPSEGGISCRDAIYRVSVCPHCRDGRLSVSPCPSSRLRRIIIRLYNAKNSPPLEGQGWSEGQELRRDLSRLYIVHY